MDTAGTERVCIGPFRIPIVALYFGWLVIDFFYKKKKEKKIIGYRLRIKLLSNCNRAPTILIASKFCFVGFDCYSFGQYAVSN